uniref:Receptor for retinol uptake STRA6 n=1 Tax=Terrapene triunguis TaxID=2587831 RepID=A0A674I4C6_9SAUR
MGDPSRYLGDEQCWKMGHTGTSHWSLNGGFGHPICSHSNPLLSLPLPPDCCSPVNFLEAEGHQGLVAAVFGILFSSICVLVLDTDPLPFIASSSPQYWKIMALLYYPAFYYPLIACATIRHRAGYFVGCLLSWCHCVVHIWQKVDCPQSPKWKGSGDEWLMLGIGRLSFTVKPQVSFFLKEPKVGINVVQATSEQSPCNLLTQCRWKKAGIGLLSHMSPYHSGISGFQVPLKLVLSVTTAVIAVYQVALLLLVVFIPNIQIVRAGMTKEITVLLVQFGVVPSENPAVPVCSLTVCYVCSLVLSCLLTFSMLMRSLVMHRANLKALYRGDVLDVFYRARMLCPSQQALVCWMSFASFQTAFACLGLLTQQVIFFVCTVGFTFLVVIPLQSGTNMHLFKILENMWPFWLTLVLAVVVQNLLAHFHFLEKHHLQKELTNRRALCIMTYLLFPINVLVGVLAGVWRMVISALYNAVHFCQLDISLLNRGVEAFDPGYRTYCHYLKIEVSQSHPVMKAFCFLLLQLSGPEGQTGLKPTDVEEGIQLMQPVKGLLKASKSKQTRARWGLAYTLLNNPSLLACRKTVLSDPTANGTQSCPAKP